MCIPALLPSLSLDTDNDLASEEGGYENITVTHLPAQPTVDFLKYLNYEVKPGDVSADCILHYLLFLLVCTLYRSLIPF